MVRAIVNTLRPGFIFVLAALFLCFEMGLQVSPSVMTAPLMHDLRLNALGLGVMSGFYYYTYTVMQLPAGLLFDRFNVRIVVVIPLIICAIGAYLFSLADNIYVGSLARLLMGAGSAFAFISVLVVASDVFKGKHFALLTGLTQMLAAFGAIGGQLPLVPIIHHYGWRHTMQLLALIALVLSLLIWLFVRYEGAEKLRRPRKDCTPIIPSLKKIIHKRDTWIIALYACVLWAPMAAVASLWGVPFIQHVYHLSHAKAASIISLMWLGIAFGSPTLGWWSDRIGRRRLPLLTAALIGLIAFTLVVLALPIPTWLLATLVFIAGMACAGQALSFAVVKDVNQPSTMAAAIGFNNMAVVIAGAIFQPLIGRLIEWHHQCSGMHVGAPGISAASLQHGMWAIVVSYAIGVIVTLLIKK